MLNVAGLVDFTLERKIDNIDLDSLCIYSCLHGCSSVLETHEVCTFEKILHVRRACSFSSWCNVGDLPLGCLVFKCQWFSGWASNIHSSWSVSQVLHSRDCSSMYGGNANYLFNNVEFNQVYVSAAFV